MALGNTPLVDYALWANKQRSSMTLVTVQD
jgi:hypothetical protein